MHVKQILTSTKRVVNSPQSLFSIEPPVEIANAGVSYAWTDINVSAYVPVGATGVILHVDRGATGAVRDYGIRMNGNADTRDGNAGAGLSHGWAIVGIDANRIFEFYNVGPLSRCALDLIGYTTAGVDFTPSIANAPEISPAAGAWNTVNLGPGGLGLIPANAIGVIIEVYDFTPNDTFGLRQNGSTDNRITASLGNHMSFSYVIGVDAGQIIELYRGTTGIRFYLHAYITSGATFYLNGVDVTPIALGWQDLPALPVEATMGFYELSSLGGQRYGLRSPGSAFNDYLGVTLHNSGFMRCDPTTRIVQARLENLADSIHLIGHANVSL